MGSNIWAASNRRDRRWRARLIGLSVSMVVAFAWEAFERFAEPRWPDIWLTPESILNSYVSDPLTCLLGVLGIFWLLDRGAGKPKALK
jgi:hypothetical protein